MSAVLYVFGISFVATILFVGVNNIEPNRRYALVLKLLIVFVNVVTITQISGRRRSPSQPARKRA